MNETVRQAILNTPIDYFTKTLLMWNPGPEAQGSMFIEEQDLHSLSMADWQPYEHAAIAAPARGFKAPIAGLLGVVKVANLDPDELIHFVPSKNGTGFVDAVVITNLRDVALLRKPIDFSVALIGPGEDGKDMLWTVFPGDPIQPSTVHVEGIPEVIAVPAKHAAKVGIKWAKVEVQK